METLTRGKVAKLVGIGPETIRFYERKGILPKPNRTLSGYRVYSNEMVNRLRFIKRAQELGFSLDEIMALLKLRLQQNADCSRIREKAKQNRQMIREKVIALKQIDRALASFIVECDANKNVDFCPILIGIENGVGYGNHE